MLPGASFVGLWSLLVGVQPHVGGIPTLAYFDSPSGVGLVADTSYTLTWTDNDMDETGAFTFYYQPVDLAMRATPTTRVCTAKSSEWAQYRNPS